MIFEAEAFLPLMWMHTFFMTFPIDIVFLGRGNVVINIQSSLKPWRLSSIVFGAHKAIELCAGAAARAKTAVGDLISFGEVLKAPSRSATSHRRNSQLKPTN
jgi:uncharacterized membrane protein (UPF0127 family)